MNAKVMRVKTVVADQFNITVADIDGPSKARQFAWPRQVAMQLVYDRLGLSFPKTAEAFNRGAGSTAQYAVRLVRARIGIYTDDKSNHEQITERLVNNL